MSELKKNIAATNVELQTQKNNVKNLSADQGAKKRQMTSHLFVLSAKIETDQNYLVSKEKEWSFHCKNCGAKPSIKKNSPSQQ